MNIAGHFWTTWPLIEHRLGKLTAVEDQAWSTEIEDGRHGAIRMTGRLLAGRDAWEGRLLVAVHGLGGCVDSHYLARLIRVAEERGANLLRLNLRGADRSGQDLYHAGIDEDIAKVIASSELSGYRRIDLIGYSLGGHLVLRYGVRGDVDPRLGAIISICPPVDLSAAVEYFDRPTALPYRRYILSGLNDTYAAVAGAGRFSVPVEEMRGVRKLREWDRRIICERFGFPTPEDYYEACGLVGQLDRLAVPTLVVASRADPMIPAAGIANGLRGASAEVEVVWSPTAGHVSFPPRPRLGLGSGSIEEQVFRWLEQRD